MLTSEEYSLRTLEEKDLPLVLEWRNSEKIRTYMYTDHIISIAEHMAWYERLSMSQQTIYKIFEYQGIPAGVVNFTDHDKMNNCWSWGFYLGREGLPRGSGIIMGKLGLQMAFEQLEAEKLSGECFAFNIASIHFHQKLGFQEEGNLVKYVYKNGIGSYQEVISFGLLKEIYLKRAEDYESY